MTVSRQTREQLRAQVREALLTKYHKFRAKHPGAYGLNCFNWAKGEVNNPRPTLDWDTPSGRHPKKYGEMCLAIAEWDEGPFHFMAELVPDSDADFEDFGRFEDRSGSRYDKYEARPSVGHEDAIWLEFSDQGRGWNRGWFIPGYSYDERRKDYRKAGYSRQVSHEMAREAVRDDAKRYADLYRGEWQYVGVCVHATVCGVTVDSEDLWGVDFEYPEYEYVTEVAHDMAGQVKHKALKEVEDELDSRLQALRSAVEARKALVGEDVVGNNLAQSIHALIDLRTVVRQVREAQTA